ncbi:MAG: hypothetical protein KZQ88_15460 [Candidatus Thiodiazotropha sp. (ex Dulcina madagascariensis)]|nr:hypothetical protein [Candidatus Thiodiazotropha sp. (ex Dulcina madagascariensis)]MCU7926327.1 hypothetical protein [Candidatus Thiodiazotropha sp. (ex Dulcina madagascariensis)]
MMTSEEAVCSDVEAGLVSTGWDLDDIALATATVVGAAALGSDLAASGSAGLAPCRGASGGVKSATVATAAAPSVPVTLSATAFFAGVFFLATAFFLVVTRFLAAAFFFATRFFPAAFFLTVAVSTFG